MSKPMEQAAKPSPETQFYACPQCGGNGWYADDDGEGNAIQRPCEHCNGEGGWELTAEETRPLRREDVWSDR